MPEAPYGTDEWYESPTTSIRLRLWQLHVFRMWWRRNSSCLGRLVAMGLRNETNIEYRNYLYSLRITKRNVCRDISHDITQERWRWKNRSKTRQAEKSGAKIFVYFWTWSRRTWVVGASCQLHPHVSQQSKQRKRASIKFKFSIFMCLLSEGTSVSW